MRQLFDQIRGFLSSVFQCQISTLKIDDNKLKYPYPNLSVKIPKTKTPNRYTAVAFAYKVFNAASLFSFSQNEDYLTFVD